MSAVCGKLEVASSAAYLKVKCSSLLKCHQVAMEDLK